MNDKITFEVEGKNKDGSQIRKVENAWLALDNIEIGQGNRIPLWLFGYLYLRNRSAVKVRGRRS